MARDRASIRVDMWADGDFRRLSVYAQWLYMALLSHPTLSYAGVADWRPGRIAAFSAGAAVADITDAAEELMRGRFILTDEVTEEVLVRSFIKHDGLLKQPKLTVSMCNAFAAVASTPIREVIAFELQKLHDREPDLKAWSVAQMQTVLRADAAPIEQHLPKGLGDGLPIGLPLGLPESEPLGLGLPTATATSTATPLHKEGGVPESKISIPPSPFCKRHEKSEGTDQPCRGCKVAAEKYEAWAAMLEVSNESYTHRHRWLADGTCIGCEERSDAA